MSTTKNEKGYGVVVVVLDSVFFVVVEIIPSHPSTEVEERRTEELGTKNEGGRSVFKSQLLVFQA